VGGIDRIVIAKRDPGLDLCFNVVLASPSSGPGTAGLTLPPGFSLESAAVGPGYPCPVRSSMGTRAGAVTGSVTAVDFVAGGSTFPAHVNADLSLSFAPNDAGAPGTVTFAAQDLDVRTACQQ
jgi:hypothetical protein